MIDELYEQIGRLKLELEWLKQKRECLIERGESVQGQRAHWVAMARWAASAMLIYFVIESSVSSG